MGVRISPSAPNHRRRYSLPAKIKALSFQEKSETRQTIWYFPIMKPRYVVGIDLGTTNCAVAFADLHGVEPNAVKIESFKIKQLVNAGRLGDRPTLPSFLYIPGPFDLQKGDIALPWDEERDYAVGVFAREQGVLVPGRLVSSAKSWLCHGGVDREAPILPWGADPDVKKVSPVEASRAYLQHIREAWDFTMPEPLSDQLVVLTVPASFDAAARELTLKAAKEAGLNVVLLEEPLAAFYAFLSEHEGDWRDFIKADDRILICDVGGGTTDFTLVACEEAGEVPRLERLAVGDHLLLGGDNMDLALAAYAEKELNQELDARRWQALLHQCRKAKEELLGQASLDKATLRLTGAGKKLIGGTIRIELAKEKVLNAILEGFFPKVTLEEARKAQTQGAGLREMGLPYETDPAVTRHLGRFLLRQGNRLDITAVMYNGGALKPDIIKRRLTNTISSWVQAPIRELETSSLDLAVSFGAAYYGLVRMGIGLKVGGGIPRSYFIGVGYERGVGSDKAVCLIERGSEEGAELELPNIFKVRTNRPVSFILYSSTVRHGDRLGETVTVSDDMVKLPPLVTSLKYGKKGRDMLLPVRIKAQVTNVGTIEVYCISQESPHKWRLQFDLRAKDKQSVVANHYLEGVRVRTAPAKGQMRLSEHDHDALEKIGKDIHKCFTKGEKNALSPTELTARISEHLGMGRELWPVPVLRAIADMLFEHKSGRSISPSHELRWLNLTGFGLRPGVGDVQDPWRIKKAWPLFFEGLFFAKDQGVRIQWWIFWRRIAAGLGTGHQNQLFSLMKPILATGGAKGKGRRKKAKTIKVSREEAKEIWLCAANLERLETSVKRELGETVLKLIGKNTKSWPLWVISRLGARQLLYGPADKVIRPGLVQQWAKAIMNMEWKRPEVVAQCLVSLGRVTGDRARDLPADFRQDLCTYLETLGVSPEKLLPLKKLVRPDEEYKNLAFGEHLPPGLILAEEENGWS